MTPDDVAALLRWCDQAEASFPGRTWSTKTTRALCDALEAAWAERDREKKLHDSFKWAAQSLGKDIAAIRMGPLHALYEKERERAERAEAAVTSCQREIEIKSALAKERGAALARVRALQTEKEHGWQEAERWEARALRAEAAWEVERRANQYTAPADAVIEVLAPALPEEPAPWSIVSDMHGDAWQRSCYGGGSTWQVAATEETRSWEDLNRSLGPLTVLREGRGQ